MDSSPIQEAKRAESRPLSNTTDGGSATEVSPDSRPLSTATYDTSTTTDSNESRPQSSLTDEASCTTDSTEAPTPKMAHDSMVTVRLSEPPSLTLDTSVGDGPGDVNATETQHSDANVADNDSEAASARDSAIRNSTASTTTVSQERSLQDELAESSGDDDASDRPDKDEVNWERLEKTEDEQPKDEDTDNSTALLLARLEQENAKLATNPKSVKVRVAEEAGKRPRPPSMAQLQQMVNGPTPSALRYSMLPPPAMTDLEFYAALVKDYQQTAARLPTLLSNKIRKGIPPPLRGVVWQSMSGARDAALEEQYERFCGESSPYEMLIGKDLGRSFPGVDMFRDPEGDGQRMLGRVLKSFSLYDTKIGYCQGLAFLVGPLLMHMPEKQAFCVLIRLMDHYDLRTCFLPDLSGLHVRIYQFRELLRQNLPGLSTHLEELQVDPAYVSQWFLSFFAVTCPLPMLFRIYDVIFAEGASETLMRVALSLMRKNETRLLSCTELEDVMQLLLSRGLWDCYHYDADEFVQDFVSLTSEVSREKLGQLEQGYRESLVATANATRTSDITTAASRFLGRIWATSTTISPKSATLSPNLSAPSRPLSMLRRSTSKQSLASTLNSMEASSVSVTSSTSTDASTVSRDSSRSEDEPSSRESTPVGSKSIASIKTVEDKYLHSQIEDLLTALSELQRNHAIVSDQLQREQEERQEDHEMVRSLLDGLRVKATLEQTPKVTEEKNAVAVTNEGDGTDEKPVVEDENKPSPSTEDLSELLEKVEGRFAPEKNKRLSSMAQTKSQLRDDLAQAKDQLACAISQSQEFSRKIIDLNSEVASVKDQLRESHAHVRSLHQDKQRLEKQVHSMRARSSAVSAGEAGNRETESDWPNKANKGGLREFKLARSKSSPSQGGLTKRMSSLPTEQEQLALSGAPAITTTESSSTEQDLLHELVQAKTAEAIAKQDAEESRQKLEAFRKAYGLTPADNPPPATPTGAGALGVFGRLTGQGTGPATESNHKPAASTSTITSGGGGFWGWRK